MFGWDFDVRGTGVPTTTNQTRTIKNNKGVPHSCAFFWYYANRVYMCTVSTFSPKSENTKGNLCIN